MKCFACQFHPELRDGSSMSKNYKKVFAGPDIRGTFLIKILLHAHFPLCYF